MRHHTQEHLVTNFVSTPEYLLLEIRRLSQSQESSLVFMGGHGASYSRDTTIDLASAPLYPRPPGQREDPVLPVQSVSCAYQEARPSSHTQVQSLFQIPPAGSEMPPPCLVLS